MLIQGVQWSRGGYLKGQNGIFILENNINKVPQNYKLTSRIGFVIFAPSHKVEYYQCTAKQSFIIFAQIEIVNYNISTFAHISIWSVRIGTQVKEMYVSLASN